MSELAGRLDLELSPDGTPGNPLVVVDLDEWGAQGTREIAAAASAVGGALPVTAGVLRGPMTPALAPLVESLTLTLGNAPSGCRAIIPVSELPEEPTLTEAAGRLREAVERSPRAAVACGQLVRQTAVLDTTGGLAAEAAAYSLLLGGPEFARWLARYERTRGGAARHVEAPAEPVLLDRDGDRLTVTLNAPERRNAFSAAMREALLDAMLLAQADPSIEAVSLRGAGPSFCSGGDLDEFGVAKDLVAAYLVRLARAPWRVIDQIASRVTVYAHGACVGAGTEMLAYAGRVVASRDAFFQLPEVQMGLVPGAGGSVSVPRRTGRHRAAWLMLTGDRLPAPTALSWGLVDAIG